MWKLAVCAVLALGLGACQKKNEKFSYELTENGCPTGAHEYSSKSEYCAALRDDRTNNYCARSLREERYKADCGGDF
jgi:hypothetical protein